MKIRGNTVGTPMRPDKAFLVAAEAMTEEQKAQVRENIGADQVFIAEYGKTSFADMAEAYSAGKMLFCREGNNITALYQITSSGDFTFYRINATTLTNLYCSPNKWGKTVSGLCDARHTELENQIQALEERIASLEQLDITFTFRGVEHTARKGMTWAEFVVSNYNPTVECPAECGDMIRQFCIDTDQVSYSEPYVCLDNSCGPVEAIYTEDGSYVWGSDPIIPGHEYH